MPQSKPFYRNKRGMKPAPNAGYSGWAYIEDRDYADHPEHYTRPLLLIIDDLKGIFEYVEPADECRAAYSYRIHALLMRTCIEIEANFKAIFDANTFNLPARSRMNMVQYRRIDVSHHLSSYEALLPIWRGKFSTMMPFAPWRPERGKHSVGGIVLPWYQAYNNSKHDRQKAFTEANLWHLVEAVAALLILVSSQFGSSTFGSGSKSLDIGYDYHPHEGSIGELFRLKYPSDWSDADIYDFDWSKLKSETIKFEKIDYNAIVI